jgi:vacuolar-type H+-ATPase catalytic subunit A/Vma1
MSLTAKRGVRGIGSGKTKVVLAGPHLRTLTRNSTGRKIMSELTNTELLNRMHEAAADLSYYNAAEGSDYYREKGARAIAQKHWNTLVEEAVKRGLYEKGDWLEYLV